MIAELQVTRSKEIFPSVCSKLLHRGGTPKGRMLPTLPRVAGYGVKAFQLIYRSSFTWKRSNFLVHTMLFFFSFFLHKFPDPTKKVSTWFDLKHQNEPRWGQRDLPLAHALGWITAEMHASLIDNGSFIKQCKIYKFRGIFKKSLLKNYSNTFQ